MLDRSFHWRNGCRSIPRRVDVAQNRLIYRDTWSNNRAMSSTAVLPRKRGRPAKDEGDYRATREALLNAGVAVLTEKGFSATGIDEILKSVGVPKGSFYHFFAARKRSARRSSHAMTNTSFENSIASFWTRPGLRWTVSMPSSPTPSVA